MTGHFVVVENDDFPPKRSLFDMLSSHRLSSIALYGVGRTTPKNEMVAVTYGAIVKVYPSVVFPSSHILPFYCIFIYPFRCVWHLFISFRCVLHLRISFRCIATLHILPLCCIFENPLSLFTPSYPLTAHSGVGRQSGRRGILPPSVCSHDQDSVARSP